MKELSDSFVCILLAVVFGGATANHPMLGKPQLPTYTRSSIQEVYERHATAIKDLSEPLSELVDTLMQVFYSLNSNFISPPKFQEIPK